MTFAQILRELCKESGISLRELSSRMGMSHTATGHWARGKNLPPHDRVMEMAGIFGLSGARLDEFIKSAAIAHVPDGLADRVSTMEREVSVFARRSEAAIAVAVELVNAYVTGRCRKSIANVLEHGLDDGPEKAVAAVREVLNREITNGGRK